MMTEQPSEVGINLKRSEKHVANAAIVLCCQLPQCCQTSDATKRFQLQRPVIAAASELNSGCSGSLFAAEILVPKVAFPAQTDDSPSDRRALLTGQVC